MSLRIVVTGTDTDVGKTVFSAGLVNLLQADYWKPVQSGLVGETDTQAVARLGAIAGERLLTEKFRLAAPLSPHAAARKDGMRIDETALDPPIAGDRPLVIEAAGGLMVPLNDSSLFIDVFARWRLPVVLCARTSLGTINHSLLSIEALRRRSVPLLGIAFIGDAQEETQETICRYGRVRCLGRLPWLNPLTPAALQAAFPQAFSRQAFDQ